MNRVEDAQEAFVAPDPGDKQDVQQRGTTRSNNANATITFRGGGLHRTRRHDTRRDETRRDDATRRGEKMHAR